MFFVVLFCFCRLHRPDVTGVCYNEQRQQDDVSTTVSRQLCTAEITDAKQADLQPSAELYTEHDERDQ